MCHGRCVRVMTRGLEMSVLEGINVWLIDGCGYESFTGVRYTGFVDGDTENNQTRSTGSFSMDDSRFQTDPFFMFYIIY